MAELCGVEQATVSRWESGRHTPDRATRNRLRAIFHAQDSKLDQSIIRSVRYAHTCAVLTLADSSQVIEASLGGCRLQDASRTDLIDVPPADWFRYINRRQDTDRTNTNALKNGDMLAIQATMEIPIFRTEEKIPVVTTFTPLWFADGTFLLRWDTSLLPIAEYQGQSIKAITGDGAIFELDPLS